MACLYHAVPPVMVGTVLYPLNRLKDIHPEAYQRAIRKYEGREHTMLLQIPALDCLWNDVLFLTAAHPKEMRAALDDAEFPYRPLLRSYEFDLATLDPALLAVRYHKRGKPKQHAPFDLAQFDAYRAFHEDSVAYLKECIALETRMMLFAHVPHIFYRGKLDIRGVSVVEG